MASKPTSQVWKTLTSRDQGKEEETGMWVFKKEEY